MRSRKAGGWWRVCEPSPPSPGLRGTVPMRPDAWRHPWSSFPPRPKISTVRCCTGPDARIARAYRRHQSLPGSVQQQFSQDLQQQLSELRRPGGSRRSGARLQPSGGVGEVVARDAQEQAACLEETSASLEEISATTRQNAGFMAHGAFQEVSAAIAGCSRVASEIAASSEEQSRGVTHIGEAIAPMEAVTQNNAANAQHRAENASSMTARWMPRASISKS
jgi:hypothetical protein